MTSFHDDKTEEYLCLFKDWYFESLKMLSHRKLKELKVEGAKHRAILIKVLTVIRVTDVTVEAVTDNNTMTADDDPQWEDITDDTATIKPSLVKYLRNTLSRLNEIIKRIDAKLELPEPRRKCVGCNLSLKLDAFDMSFDNFSLDRPTYKWLCHICLHKDQAATAVTKIEQNKRYTGCYFYNTKCDSYPYKCNKCHYSFCNYHQQNHRDVRTKCLMCNLNSAFNGLCHWHANAKNWMKR